LRFSLFKEAGAKDVIVGKDNYLFELNYIKAFTGKDRLPVDSIKLKITQLKELQDILGQQGKTLIVGLAAGKASYFPEYIPDRYGKGSAETNYHLYAKGLKDAGVNLLDINQWFLNEKTRSRYPLFPKAGIHWSSYGSLLVLDSLIKQIELLRNEDLPSIKIDRIEISGSPKGSDNDIGEAMNMFSHINYPLAYPEYSVETDSNKKKLSVMVIADSFFWTVYEKTWGRDLFKFIEFRYYNQEIHNSENPVPVMAGGENWSEKTARTDVVFLLCTEANLSRFPWGFTDQMLKGLRTGN
jgi:hypothetical protein